MISSGMNLHTRPAGSKIYLLILFFISAFISALPFFKTTVSISAAGIVRPKDERTEIKSMLSGLLDSVHVKEGELVKKGQLIAVFRDNYTLPKLLQNQFERKIRRIFIQDLDALTSTPDLDQVELHSPHYRQQLNKIIFELLKQQTAIRKVKREQEINRVLLKDSIIAPKEKFDKEIEAEILLANLNAWKNEQMENWHLDLQRNKMELSRFIVEKQLIETDKRNHFIYAPVSGVVQNIHTRYAGGFVNAGETLCTISPSGVLIGECYVNARDVGLLKTGQQVRFQIDAFYYNYFGVLTGRIIYIEDDFTITAEKPHFKVRCSFDSNQLFLKNGYKGKLKKGLTFQSRFIIAERTLWQLLFDRIDDWLNPTAPTSG